LLKFIFNYQRVFIANGVGKNLQVDYICKPNYKCRLPIHS